MLNVILKMIVPYVVMFIEAYSATWLIWHGKPHGHLITPSPEKRRKRAPMGVMDTILIIELIAIVLYIVVDFWVFWHVGAEPSTLTMGFFAVCGGENGFMAWIKTRKEQERFRDWQKQDEGKGEEYKKDTSL